MSTTSHPHGPGDYEVDHLIPLELGGSNSIKNLWPESHRTSPWNAQVKDRLEGKLHELVCSGRLDLKTARQAIAANWIGAYKLYVGPNSPVSWLSSPVATESPLNADEVWVNTIRNPVRDIMAKPNRANIFSKKTRSRKGIGQRTVQENEE